MPDQGSTSELAPIVDPASLRDREDTTEPVIERFRKVLGKTRAELERRFRAGRPVGALVHHHAAAVDEILAAAWSHFELQHESSTALIAVGGYGRGELHPASDVDLLLLRETDTPMEVEERIRQFVTFLWDIGLEVGHSVRTVSECVALASEEVTVATNLMEARWLAGSRWLFDKIKERTGSDIWSSTRFFEAKLAEQQNRHHKYNDTAHNLEPNIKDGPGGLRDIQMIGWVAKRHFGADALHELVVHGFLTEPEYQTLIQGQTFLWRIRFALHLHTGRREERLLFDHQRTLAELFGYRDQEHSLAVEQFMKPYYRTIMELSRLNEMLLSLFKEAILYQDVDDVLEPINERFRARNGFLEVVDDHVFARDPVTILELFLILQQRPDLLGVRASTIRLVRAHQHLIDEDFRNDPRPPLCSWISSASQEASPTSCAECIATVCWDGIYRCSAISRGRCNTTCSMPTRWTSTPCSWSGICAGSQCPNERRSFPCAPIFSAGCPSRSYFIWRVFFTISPKAAAVITPSSVPTTQSASVCITG